MYLSHTSHSSLANLSSNYYCLTFVSVHILKMSQNKTNDIEAKVKTPRI